MLIRFFEIKHCYAFMETQTLLLEIHCHGSRAGQGDNLDYLKHIGIDKIISNHTLGT